MQGSLCRYWFLLVCVIPIFDAHALERCASKADDWTCFSKIEVQPGAKEPTWRMVLFQNHELLAEIEEGGATKRYLVAQPSGIQLYSGLSATESIPSGGKNPFAFMDLGFALPITALQIAFPVGPSSVADGESKSNILVEGKPITINTVRHNANQIRFRLESSTIHVAGLWERVDQSPLPGSYSLVGWKTPTGTQFTSLDEARSAHAPRDSR